MTGPRDSLFRTDAVRADLRTHSVRSGFIAIGARVAQALIQLVAVVVLARLLTPADFGVIAYVVPVAVLAVTLTNNALQSAVIHREHLDNAQATALFRLAATVNLLVCAVLAAGAPLLARFYDEPRVTAVTMAWAAVIYITSLAALPEALMKRQMRFGMVMGAHVTGLALGAGLAIVAALAGAGYWALFVQVATPPLTRGAWVSLRSGWRPAASHEATPESQAADPVEASATGSVPSHGVTAMRRYWSGLAGFRFVAWAGDQLDRVLVGFTGSAAVLGFYDGARRWGWYPLTELIIALTDVAVSSFSRIRENAGAYRAYVRKGTLAVLALPLPLIAFVFVAADEVVLVLLGRQWLPAVPYVRLMCVAAFIGAPNRLTPWLYLSRGQTGRQLRWALFQAFVTILALASGATRGPMGVAFAFTVITCLLTWPGVAWAVRESPVTMGDIVLTTARPAIAALAAAVALQFVRDALLPDTMALLRVALEAPFFGIVFLAAWLLLPGGRDAMREAVTALRELDPRRVERGRVPG